MVPAGTAFRSGAFDGHPPQVFETDAAAAAHPALNRHAVVPPRATALAGTVSYVLLEPATALAREGDVVLVDAAGVHLRRLARVARMTDTDRRTYVRADLDAVIDLASPVPFSAARLSKPTQQANLRSPVDASEQAPFVESAGSSRLTLDGVYLQIKTGDRVLVSRGAEHRWSAVVARAELAFTVSPAVTVTVGGSTVTSPASRRRTPCHAPAGSRLTREAERRHGRRPDRAFRPGRGRADRAPPPSPAQPGRAAARGSAAAHHRPHPTAFCSSTPKSAASRCRERWTGRTRWSRRIPA